MNQREAFEAWWKDQGQYSRAGGGDYEKTFAFNAYQYALNVAVRACESRIMGDHNREDQEAQRCADAIKEALK